NSHTFPYTTLFRSLIIERAIWFTERGISKDVGISCICACQKTPVWKRVRKYFGGGCSRLGKFQLSLYSCRLPFRYYNICFAHSHTYVWLILQYRKAREWVAFQCD